MREKPEYPRPSAKLPSPYSMSPRARSLSDLASEIDRQDKVMRDAAEVLLSAMKKRDALMVCLKQLAKEMK